LAGKSGVREKALRSLNLKLKGLVMPARKKSQCFTPVSFRFSPEEIATIKKIATQKKITKTQVLREGIKALAKTS